MGKIDLSIVILGKICSGKSTLAKDFSKWLNYPIASFGSFLEKYSRDNNLPITREALQNLGVKLIAKQPIDFLHNVIAPLSPISSRIIFEGVRHRVILDEIKHISNKTFSIYLDVREDVRIKRFIQREKSIDSKDNAEEDFYIRSSHLVEGELDTIKSECNYVISSNDNYRDFLQALSLNV